jgi:hypothetical protein
MSSSEFSIFLSSAAFPLPVKPAAFFPKFLFRIF